MSRKMKETVALVLAVLAIIAGTAVILTGCGGQEAFTVMDDSDKPAPTANPSPTPAPETKPAQPATPARITSVLMTATFTCTDCEQEDADLEPGQVSKTELAAKAQETILKGFDKLVNDLGTDIKVKPQAVTVELNSDSNAWAYNGNLVIMLDGTLLTSEAFPWLVQKALSLATEAWAFTRLTSVNSLPWVRPLAEAASMMSLYGEQATCQYFAGVESGLNRLITSLCDAGAMTATNLRGLTQTMGAASAGPNDDLTKQEYLNLWTDHFGQAAASKAIQDSGILNPEYHE